MTEYRIVVREDGHVQWIYSDALKFLHELGEVEIWRASHVEPTASGQWAADLFPVSGPVLGPFPLRSAALAAEVAWLEEHIL